MKKSDDKITDLKFDILMKEIDYMVSAIPIVALTDQRKADIMIAEVRLLIEELKLKIKK